MLFWDFAIMGLAGDEGTGDGLKCVVERLVIQKDPIVVVVSVKAILDLTNRSCDLPNILISCKRNKCRIDSLSRSGR